MSNTETPIEMLFEKVEDYSKITLELLKLKTIYKSADVISSFAMRFALFIMVALFTIFASIGLALLIGDMLGKSYYGFFIIAGFYALAVVVLRWYLHPWVKTPISNFIITQILNQKTP
jgi:hypothetical protein